MTKLKEAIEAAKAAGTPKFRIAHAVGVSESTLSNWAYGETKPNIDQARRLAEVLNMPIEKLFPQLQNSTNKIAALSPESPQAAQGCSGPTDKDQST